MSAVPSNIALDPRASVSVSASAGSGKTWQLVSRVLRLLLEGAAPGGILALTFTRKAASEMRERVEARLAELAFASDTALDSALRQLDLEPTPALRQRARGLHERLLFSAFGLRAQTLHAFCQDLLTRFAVEADVPPGFSLIENEAELVNEALETLLSALHRQPDSREARALSQLIELDAGESTIRGWLKGFIERRGDWWAYSEEWLRAGEDPIDALSEALAQALRLDLDDDTPPHVAFAHPNFLMALQQVHDLLVECEGIGHLKAELIAPALTASGSLAIGAAVVKLFTADGGRRSLKIKKSISQGAFDRLMDLYDALCSTLEMVRALQAARATHRRTLAAATLGVRLLEHLDAALKSRNALSFADLEWRSYRLLRDESQAEWVRYKLDARLDHLLLDEFQDTNPTQWALLKPLLEDMADDDGTRQRTAFVVGDAKQSIYGFRRANPELLGEASAYLDARLAGARMPLNASRRSAPAIIDFVNALFTGAPGAAIGFEAHETHRQADWGAVEVAALVTAQAEVPAATVTDGGLRNPLTTARVRTEDLRLSTEARQVAERIQALIAARIPVQDGAEVRALAYGDVMILARHRTHLHGIEQALAEHGIPFTGSSKGGLLDTVMARDLMALLRFLDAPARDLDLAHLLRSPLFGAGDEDLVRLAQRREAGSAWWTRLQWLVSQGEASASLQRAVRLLEAWLAAARRLPAHDLLDRIDAEAGAALRYEAALPGQGRTRANLGAFLQRILDADQGRYPTLGRLNHELKRLAESGRDAPDEAPPATTDTVRVMTIHASKGLEAPAVFLVNAAPKLKQHHAGWLTDWPSGDERPALMLLAGSADERDPVSEELIGAQQQREAREALNLLYVAVTRARQFLFVSAFEVKQVKLAESWYGLARQAVEALPRDTGALPGADPASAVYCRGAFPLLGAAAGSAPEHAASLHIDPRLRQRFAAAATVRAPSQEADSRRDPDTAARGVAIHWLIEQRAQGRALIAAQLPRVLESVCGSAVEAADIPGWLAEAERVLSAPALQHLFDPQRIVKAWNEVPVQWLDDEEARHGVIDRLVDDGTTLWIIDYKTAPRPQPELMRARHAAQIQAYVDAVARLKPGRPIKAGLVLTATATWLPMVTR